MQNVTTFENSLIELNIHLSSDPTIPRLGIYSREMKPCVHTKTHTQMFITNKWWKSTQWTTYSAMKRNEARIQQHGSKPSCTIHAKISWTSLYSDKNQIGGHLGRTGIECKREWGHFGGWRWKCSVSSSWWCLFEWMHLLKFLKLYTYKRCMGTFYCMYHTAVKLI